MQADLSTRLRLVEVQTPGGALPLGGGFACVLASPSARSAAARWIATTVVGPRPSGADGTIEIAGRFVSARSLPSPLLPPSAPSVLGQEALRAQWRLVWAQRRDELAAAHASRRLARHRSEAAYERARARLPAPAPIAPAEPVAVARPRPPVDGYGPRIDEINRQLLTLEAVPIPAALALADEWERHVAQAPPPPSPPPPPDLDDLFARVQAARAAMSVAQGGIVTGAARVEIDALHRAVGEAESEVSEARRRDRAGAIARYDAAVRAEQEALAAAGIESYASFLVNVAQGVVADPVARNRAAVELAEAEGELEYARRHVAAATGTGPTQEELLEGAVVLRARAAELLGHFPGDDPADELRAMRVEHPAGAPLRAELEHVRGEQAAAAALELARPAPATEPPPAPVVSLDDAELIALARERDLHAAAVVDLENELSRLDGVRDAHLVTLDREDLLLAVSALLDAYRRGDVLAGRLPLVLDGALDGITPGPRRAAVALLAGATDVQAILVSDDPALADAVSGAGGVVLQWPEPHRIAGMSTPAPSPTAAPLPAQPVAPQQSFPTPPQAVAAPESFVPQEPPETTPIHRAPDITSTRCMLHFDVESVAQCAQCRRACCIDCLVYVLGEPDLWCAACAQQTHGQEAKPARLLRRRGA